jgi:ATP-dependent Clp protease ATP-binding subunit ClpC
MFQRYTEKARRAISFGRDEACQRGSRYIETEHLLLGILREDKDLANRNKTITLRRRTLS